MIQQAAEAIASETEAVAVLLTGPQALGMERDTDKVYFVAVVNDPDGVIEHRFLDQYMGLDRQVEIGVFPQNFIDKLIDDGYWDMVSYRAAEALRVAVPLIDPTGYGGRAAQAMVRHLPEKRFASASVHRIKATFDDAVSLHSKGDHQGAVLVAREALRLAVELVIKTSPARPGATMEDVLKARLGDDAYRWLLEGLGISRMSEAQIREHLDHLINTSRDILKDLGIAADFLGD